MFFHTYPYLRFYPTATIAFELVVLAVAGLLLLWLATPLPAEHQPPRAALSWACFYDFWFGQAPLWQVFWPYFAALNLLLFVVDTLAKAGFATVLLWDISQLLLATTSVWWAVAVWSASANTRQRIWGVLARSCVIITGLEFLHRVVIRIRFPRDFFGCTELFLDYSTCF